MTETIYTLFVENKGYSLKYSRSKDAINAIIVSLPGGSCMMNEDGTLPNNFAESLYRDGWSQNALSILEKDILLTEDWIDELIINPESGLIYK